MSKDGKTYTFKIREGLKTHKGKPFNAEDVAYSINRMINPPNKMPIPRAGCVRETVVKATATDALTVAIQLQDPVASFIACMTNPYLGIQPKYILETIDKENRQMQPEEIDGVGPFKVDKWTFGSIYTAKRFDGYYMEGRPYLDEIQMVVLPDASSIIAALRTQRIHMVSAFATTPTVTEAKALKKEFGDKLNIVQVDAPGFRGFQINFRKPPLDDIRVREAIDLAVNRQNQLDLVLEGAGSLSGPYYGLWDWIYSFEEMSKWPGYRADKTQDLARAKQLLKDAGYASGLTIDGIICGTTSGEDCDLLVGDLGKVGITAKLARGETAANQARGRKGDFSLYYDSKGADFADPDVYNGLIYLPTAGLNWAKWEDKEFLKLYEQERVELDQTKRGQILRKMADIVRDSRVYVLTNRALLHQTWWAFLKGYVPPKDFYHTKYRFDALWMDK